jgi:hypothetical protein
MEGRMGIARLVMVLLISALWNTRAQAMETTTAGFGASSCGEFASQYRATPELAELGYFSWAKGWMSGMNASRGFSGFVIKNLASMSTEQQRMTIRKYCSDHPLASFLTAVSDLYFHLKNSDARLVQPSGPTQPDPLR